MDKFERDESLYIKPPEKEFYEFFTDLLKRMEEVKTKIELTGKDLISTNKVIKLIEEIKHLRDTLLTTNKVPVEEELKKLTATVQRWEFRYNSDKK